MGLQNSQYAGDEIYRVICTGDVVVGDEVRFERATFTGNFRNAKFSGFERITGKIIRDSYGRDKQQHTFTIELNGRAIMIIKVRNLYKQGTWRKPWENESLRHAAAVEKHTRGSMARAAREARKQESGHVYF